MFTHKVLVNIHEKKILDAMSDGTSYKLRELSELTGFSYTTTAAYLKLFRELDWVRYTKVGNTYQINQSLEFYTREQDKAPKVLMTSPLQPPTRKQDVELLHTEVVTYKLTPEEIKEREREATKHRQWIELKKGDYWHNENYHPNSRSR